MEKENSVRHFSKLFHFVICLLLLSFLTVNLVFADADCNGLTDRDLLICQIAQHLPDVKDPRLQTLPADTTTWCTHCHVEKNGNP